MAASRVGKTRRRLLLGPVALTCLLACGLLARGASGQIQIDGVPGIASSNLGPGAVPGHLVQSALNHLNDDSPSARTYRHGSLVAAQKLTKPPFVVYRLTLNLDPVCKVNEETCPRETCTLDVRQNERGDVDILKDSVHCQYLQSHFKKENSQEVIENIEKQIINQSSSLDREVQISTDHNDRPFIAVRATQSDYCPGCPYELNPSLPGLSAFGDQVVHSMDEAGISDFKHKLISIVRVTRAVPPNSNVIQYQLLMEIGETTCLRTSLIEISECSLQSNLPIKMCLVTFEERPWQADSRRITKNNCTELLNIDNEVSASVDPNSLLFESAAPNKEDDSTKTEFYDQIAQEAQEVFRMPYMDISTKDSIEGTEDSETLKELPHSKVILEKTKEKEEPTKLSDRLKEFDKFLEDFNIPIKTETTSPKNLGVPVTEQMIIKEHVGDPIDTSESPNTKVTEKTPDENEELQQSQNPVLIPTAESKRSKRSATKVLENNKYALRKLAIKAVEMIDNLDEDDKKKHVIDVIDSSSERQYHGIIYHITVEVAPTDCREAEKSTECLDEVIPGPTQICKLDVSTNEKKPLQSLKLLYYSCKNKKKTDVRMKRQILGGLSVYDKNKPEIDEYVNLGLRKVSENYEGTQEPAVHEIKNVTVQVVAGYLYRIEVDIGDSTCKKGETEKCNPLKSDKGVKRCIIKAWTRAWINNGKPEIEVKCDESRRKRSLRGQHYSESMLEQSRQWKKTEAILFSDFMKQYNKTYETEKEKLKRFQIFKENLDIIQELQINELGSGRYGVTQFADLTKEEFKKWHLGLNPGLTSENNIPLQVAEIPNVKLPPSFDWREHNAVTPVKNQGMCGSCWAFSVTGNVEGQYAIKHKKLLSLSEQELVDCDTLDSGCNGGLPDTAYRAIEQLGGLETESDYPYEAEKETCHFNRTAAKVHIRAGLNISSNETQMAQWLIQNGPMSIGINANAMQFYMGGVSHPFHFLCNPDDLDHGVLIVGYGMKSYPYFKKKLPYWLIKNSWGPHWGEQGYYRVYRGDGTCGVNKMVTSAVVE